MILTPLRGPAHPRTGSTPSGARRRATPDPSPLLPEASPRAAGGPAAGPGDSHLPARSPYLVRLQLLHQHLGRDTKDISRPQAAAEQGAAPPPTTRGRPPRQGTAQAEGRKDGLGGRAWTETLWSFSAELKGSACRPSQSEAAKNLPEAWEGQGGGSGTPKDRSQEEHCAREESPKKDRLELDPVSLLPRAAWGYQKTAARCVRLLGSQQD
nr:SH3 domain-binding glutamic acid-rich-like protein isoform X1 [Caretta caretta]